MSNCWKSHAAVHFILLPAAIATSNTVIVCAIAAGDNKNISHLSNAQQQYAYGWSETLNCNGGHEA